MSNVPAPAPEVHTAPATPSTVGTAVLMPAMTIAVLNRTTRTTDAEVGRWVRACQVQFDRDWQPAYGQKTTLVFVPRGAKAPRGVSWCACTDDSDQADALGYHDRTPDGLPIGHVFVETTIRDGAKPSVCLAHELLELRDDPTLVLGYLDESKKAFFCREPCDAVEDEAFAYPILVDGVAVYVSDFVLPAFWDLQAKGGPLSFRGAVHKPYEIAKGGYLAYYDLARGGWSQLGDQMKYHRARPRPRSRQERRRTPQHLWRNSTGD